MSASLNKVILIGNLGKDPEVRRLGSGDPVVNFTVATSERWNDKATGEKRERTEWHNIVIFNKGLARIAEQYLRKGSKVYIEGQLQTRKWQDQSGQDRYTTEIVLQAYNGELKLLDGRGGGGAGGHDTGDDYGGGSDFGRSSALESRSSPAMASAQPSRGPILDDDIPF